MKNLYWKIHRKYTLKFRQSRFDLFIKLISNHKRPLKILDVGGTLNFWKDMNYQLDKDVEIVLLNLWEIPVNHPNFRSEVGDARALKYKDAEFDFVFSNSVIEHVGDFEDQKKFAQEVQRVGRSYCIQTPNLYFPIEPHMLFPFFQFLPLSIRAYFVSKFDLGWIKKVPDYNEAKKVVQDIRLLSKKEMRMLFPGSNIFEEKVFGIAKSFVAYKMAPQTEAKVKVAVG